eukprot:760566_1
MITPLYVTQKRSSLIQKEVAWTRKELQSTIAQHGITHGIIHKSRNQNKGKFCQQTIKKFQNILILTLRSMLDDMRQHSNRAKELAIYATIRPIPSDETMVNVSSSQCNNTNHNRHITFTARQLNGKVCDLTQKQKVMQKVHRLEESIVEYQKELQEKNDLILKFKSTQRDTLDMIDLSIEGYHTQTI